MPPAYQSAVSSPFGVACGGAQPQPDHGEPHDRVAEHHGDGLAVREDVGHPGSEEQRPDHDHEGEQPEDHVVVVVGRGEPRVVQPGPPDREPGHRVAQDRAVVRLGEPVVQLGGVARDGDDEDEVEEQLERGRGAPVLAGVARDHGSAQRHGDDAHGPSMPSGQPRGSGSPGPGRTRTRPGPDQRERQQGEAHQVGPGAGQVGGGTTTDAWPGVTTGRARVRLAAADRGHVDQGGARRRGQPRLDDERRGGVVDDDDVGVLAGDGDLHDAARPAGPAGPHRRHPLGERVGDDDRAGRCRWVPGS